MYVAIIRDARYTLIINQQYCALSGHGISNILHRAISDIRRAPTVILTDSLRRDAQRCAPNRVQENHAPPIG